MTFHGRRQPPLGDLAFVRCERPKFNGIQSQMRRGAVEGRRIKCIVLQIEHGCQPLLVHKHLWLDGGNRHLVGIARAHVADQHGQLGGQTRLHHVRRERIVGIDVALDEVVEMQIGRRADRQGNGYEFHGRRLAGERIRVGDRTAETIELLLRRRRAAFGDKADHRRTRTTGRDGQSAIQHRTVAHVAARAVRENDEQIFALVAVLVQHRNIHLQVGQFRRRVAVVERQRSVKRLPRHRQRLRQFKFHRRADLFLELFVFGLFLLVHLVEIIL